MVVNIINDNYDLIFECYDYSVDNDLFSFRELSDNSFAAPVVSAFYKLKAGDQVYVDHRGD